MTENHNNHNNNHHNNHHHNNNHQNNNHHNNRRQRNSGHSNMLPPARVLEHYENIEPGSVGKLMELAKKEQDHRHSWQDRYLKFHNFSYKSGILCGFIYNVALLALVYKLIEIGKTSLGLRLFVINAILIAFAITVTFVERRMVTRKPLRRNAGNNKNNRQFQNKKSSPR